ncbi:MAG: hypothetical protein LBK70_02215 [Clostridiales bacterium]|jgi:hypothetical protein|nr:hypothetical protein [Clostridiales bacterium]
MNNVKTQSKKLKLALVVAFVLLVNIVIGIMAATGLVYAARPERLWGVGDLKVGDKIQLSTTSWRVIELESYGIDQNGSMGETTSGVLLRLEGHIEGVFDNQMEGIDYRSNSVTQGGVANNYTRATYGTNYLEEATIRQQLETEILDKIVEQDIIATIPQQQVVWWGEARRLNPVDNTFSITGANATNFNPIDGITDTGTSAKLLETTGLVASPTSANVTGSAKVDAVATSESDANILRYTIEDRIFLPNVNQIKKIKDAKIQGIYSTDGGYLTRTPFASNQYSGTQVLRASKDHASLDSVPATMEVGSNILVPMIYLDRNTVFKGVSTGDSYGYKTYHTASNNKDQYGYSDVLVGDYMTIGGIRWRVIAKDATNGFKLRVDRTLGTAQFDAKRSLPRTPGELIDRPAINSVISTNTRSRATTIIPENRLGTGSNFYWESDIRAYLTGEFLNKFVSYELNQINTVKQALNFWWGDHVASVNSSGQQVADGQGVYSAATNARYTDLYDQTSGDAINRHFDRFDQNSPLYKGKPATSSESEIKAPLAGQTAPQLANTTGTSYTTAGMGFNNNLYIILGNLPTYWLSDKVFVPSLWDAYNIPTDLKNAKGATYRAALDASGADQGYFTTTPNLDRNQGKNMAIGSSLLGVTKGGGSAYYASATEDDDSLVPMMYLKANTELDAIRSIARNTGENLVQRPTYVTNTQTTDNYTTRRGWREFAIATNGRTADTLTEADFANPVVAQANTSIQLSTALKYTIEGAPDGMTINSDNVLSWTPTTAGTVSFVIKSTTGEDISPTITLTVAQGRVVISNAQTISGEHGGELNNIPVTDIKADTKNILGTTITGTWGWKDGQNDLPNEGATTGRVAIFTPNGVYANNYLTTEYTFTINLSNATLLEDVQDLIEGKTLKAKYGQTLADILPDLQNLVKGQNPPITASWVEEEYIDAVGEYMISATFKRENNTATLEIKVVVEAIEASKPNMSGLKSNPTAVYEQTIEVAITFINGDNWNEGAQPNGTFEAINPDTMVGDVGDQKHTVRFVDANSNLTPTTVEITITVTAATRTETQVETIRVAVGKKLSDQNIPTGTKFADIKLPAGFKLAQQDNVAVTGSKGDTVKIDLIIQGTVKDNADNGTAANYTENKITAEFTIGETNADDNGNMILYIVLAVVGLAVVGGAVFFVLKKKQSAGSKF